ncbi:MAG: hypothetical protein AB1481_07875 [Candidatus Omnitrophota bacterium]
MKRFLAAIVFIIFFTVNSGFVYAKELCQLSDAELDEISAAGFDINIEATLAYRALVANQINTAAISSQANNALSKINNLNSSSMRNVLSVGSVNQENTATIVAANGNISQAEINNINYTYIESLGPAGIAQVNIACIIAPNGTVSDSSINNVNEIDLAGISSLANMTQINIGIIAASQIINSTISNLSLVGIAGNNVISSAADIVNSFSINGITGIVNISGN